MYVRAAAGDESSSVNAIELAMDHFERALDEASPSAGDEDQQFDRVADSVGTDLGRRIRDGPGPALPFRPAVSEDPSVRRSVRRASIAKTVSDDVERRIDTPYRSADGRYRSTLLPLNAVSWRSA